MLTTNILSGRSAAERGIHCLIGRKQSLLTDRFCSPEDHAILEAEYKRNSKPDKAARIDIVNRVSLGEKEVQVSKNKECCHLVRFKTLSDLRGTSSGAWAEFWYLDLVSEPSSNDASKVEATAATRGLL